MKSASSPCQPKINKHTMAPDSILEEKSTLGFFRVFSLLILVDILQHKAVQQKIIRKLMTCKMESGRASLLLLQNR